MPVGMSSMHFRGRKTFHLFVFITVQSLHLPFNSLLRITKYKSFDCSSSSLNCTKFSSFAVIGTRWVDSTHTHNVLSLTHPLKY